jgi:hypothetical protein
MQLDKAHHEIICSLNGIKKEKVIMIKKSNGRKIAVVFSVATLSLALTNCDAPLGSSSSSPQEQAARQEQRQEEMGSELSGAWACQGSQTGCDPSEGIQFSSDLSTMTENYEETTTNNYKCGLERVTKLEIQHSKHRHHHHERNDSDSSVTFEAEATPGEITLAQNPDSNSDCQSYVDDANQQQGSSPSPQLLKIEIDKQKQEVSLSVVENGEAGKTKVYEKDTQATSANSD